MKGEGPAYLLVADDEVRNAKWRQRLGKSGTVHGCSEMEALGATIDPETTYTSLILDLAEEHRDLYRELSLLRRRIPEAPGLLMTIESPRSRARLTESDFRWLPRSATLPEVNYFLGFSLGLFATSSLQVADAVESLGRQKSLTIKQMHLTALSATSIDRETLVAHLGVSRNTVKTRIRQLLRIHQQETMDALGKAVLWHALSLVTASPRPPPEFSIPNVVDDGPDTSRTDMVSHNASVDRDRGKLV